jgi:hypothetical protein
LRREIADLHPKLARKDKAPRTMIFFAVAAFPMSRKRFMVPRGFCHRQN